MTDAIYGVESSSASRALAEALWLNAIRGVVYTKSNSCAADYRAGCWVLHNTAWWCYGGAHKVVQLAGWLLLRTAPECVKPLGELTLTGKTLTVVGAPDGPTPAEAVIWDIAGASFDAWKDHVSALYDNGT